MKKIIVLLIALSIWLMGCDENCIRSSMRPDGFYGADGIYHCEDGTKFTKDCGTMVLGVSAEEKLRYFEKGCPATLKKSELEK